MTKSILQNLALLGTAGLVCLVAGRAVLSPVARFLSEEAALRLHWRELSEDVRNQGWTNTDRHFGFSIDRT